MSKIISKLKTTLEIFTDIVYLEDLSESSVGLYTKLLMIEYNIPNNSLEIHFRASTSPDDAVLILLKIMDIVPRRNITIGRIFEYDEKQNKYLFGDEAKRYNMEMLRDLFLRSYQQKALLMNLDDDFFGNA